MSTEEWKSKSDDWRCGYRAGQGDDTISLRLDSEEFVAGYVYALENPIGSVTVPMQLKGRL